MTADDYESIEVTPADEWDDGDTLLGFNYCHVELLGAVPTVEL